MSDSSSSASNPPDGLPSPVSPSITVSVYVEVMSPVLFSLGWFAMAFPDLVPRPFKLGRTITTMLAAFLMVLFQILSSEEAFAAVSLSTLTLLFGSMIMTYYLEREGMTRYVQKLLCSGIKAPNRNQIEMEEQASVVSSPHPQIASSSSSSVVIASHSSRDYGALILLARVCLLSGLCSAILTNDTTCVLLTPLVMSLVGRHSLPPIPFILGIATSANIGSSCSPVGNPQNMIIAAASGLSFTQFIAHLLLPTLVGMGLNILFLSLVFYASLINKSVIWTEASFDRIQANDNDATPAATSDVIISPQRLSHDVASETVPVTSVRLVQIRNNHSESMNHLDDEVTEEITATVSPPAYTLVPRYVRNSSQPRSSMDEEYDPSTTISNDVSDESKFDPNTVPGTSPLSPFDRDALATSARSLLQESLYDQEKSLLIMEQADEAAKSPAPIRNASGSPSASPMAPTIPSISTQPWHTSLNLYNESDRMEYIRRLQLEYFYDIHVYDDNKTNVSPPPSHPSALTNTPASNPPSSSSPHSTPSSPTCHAGERNFSATASLPLNATTTYVTPRMYARTNAAVRGDGAYRHDNNTIVGSDHRNDDAISIRVDASPSPASYLSMVPPPYASLRTPIPRTVEVQVAPSISSLSGVQRHPFMTHLTRSLDSLRRCTKLQWFTFALLLTILSFFSGFSLSWCALGGCLLMILFDGIDPDTSHVWSQSVDWALLLFFSGLFILVEGFHASEWTQRAWEGVKDHIDVHTMSGTVLYTLLIVVGSNTVSNVPLVLILSPSLQSMVDPSLRSQSWLLLAFISTIAGNLTLVGSVANLIVAARARPWHELTFIEYFRFGCPTTIIIIILGVAIAQI